MDWVSIETKEDLKKEIGVGQTPLVPHPFLASVFLSFCIGQKWFRLIHHLLNEVDEERKEEKKWKGLSKESSFVSSQVKKI